VFRLNIIPRDMHFFDLFNNAADNLVLASQRLVDMLEHYENVQEKARTVKDVEHDSDGITHEILNELRLTFIPPLEGDDIVALAEALDDVVDFVEDAAAKLVVYRIEAPTETAVELARLIEQIARVIQETVPLLRNKNGDDRILEACVEIHRLENLADDAQRRGLYELFDNPTDALYVIKWREIYDVLETATDRGEDVANVLEGVVRKR
jgi:predicted phosphate transport protein (TIGR00153 family)